MLANLGITRDEALLFTSTNDNQRGSCIAVYWTPFASSVCQQFLTVTQLSNLVQTKNLAPFKSNFFQCNQRRSNISGR
jgi:hypothetical protein